MSATDLLIAVVAGLIGGQIGGMLGRHLLRRWGPDCYRQGMTPSPNGRGKP